MKKILTLVLFCALFTGCRTEDPTLAALQSWKESKFGLFVHYGLYSVAGGVWEGRPIPYYAEQIMNHARIAPSDYETLMSDFTAEHFCADSIVALAKEAGMQRILFTSKHHDGFCLFNSPSSKGYNSVEGTPAHRDLVKEMADACASANMPLGLYFSLPDWHFPGSRPVPRPKNDTASLCSEFVNQVYSPLEIITPELEEYIVAQLHELLTQYGPIYTIWFDMGMPTPKQSQRFRQTVKDLQPACLVGGRVGNYCGDYLTLPDNANVFGAPESLAWDNPASMYGTWGYRSWNQPIEVNLQVERQLQRLLQTAAHGGVFMLNIGPKGDGAIVPYEKQVLQKMGKWIASHQEVVFGSQSSPFARLPKGLICTHLPASDLNGGNLYLSLTRDYPLEKLFITKTHLETQLRKAGLQNVLTDYQKGSTDESLFPYPYVIKMSYKDTLQLVQPGARPNPDGSITLSPDQALTLATYDAAGYQSYCEDAQKEWFLYDVKSGTYGVYITYLPQQTAQKYRLTITPIGDEKATKKTHPLESVFPGVDRMLQNFYAGEMIIQPNSTFPGTYSLLLESVSDNTLQPLYLNDVSVKLVPL